MLVKNIILKQLRDRNSVTAAVKISAKLPQQSSTLPKNLTLMIKAHTSRQKPSLVALSLLLAKMCSRQFAVEVDAIKWVIPDKGS